MSDVPSSSPAPRAAGGVRAWFRRDRLIYWLLIVAALVRVAALVDKGVLYDGGFDDAIRYVDSGRILAETGRYTYDGPDLSAYQMPGFSAFLALCFLVGRSGFAALLLAKTALIVVSVASIYVLYLLGRRVGGEGTGLLAAAFLAFSMPHIYAGTLTLTENAFLLGLLLATYLTIKLADEPTWKTLLALVGVFCATLYLKQAITGFLLPALVYLLLRKYPARLLLRQAAVAVAVMVLVLAPWWVRNYRVFGAFVPFTSFQGAPLFEGTFQRFQPYGTGSFEAMDEVIRDAGPSEHERSEALSLAAKERIRQRWESDPAGLLITYAVMKPAAAWLLPFYWDKVFGITGYWVLRLHAIASVVGLAALAWLSVRSKARAEFVLMLLNVAVITFGVAYYLGLSRYVYPFMPYLYVAIAYAVLRALEARRPATAPRTAG